MRKIFIAHELLDLASCNPVHLLWVFYLVIIAALVFCQHYTFCVGKKMIKFIAFELFEFILCNVKILLFIIDL